MNRAAAAAPPILDQLSALADELRTRVLLLLERHELTVSELCSVLQLPQSTVSRHLKTLLDGGWVASRPDGTRRLYRMRGDTLEASARRLWSLTRAQVARTASAAQDARRLQAVLALQRTRSQEFFAGAAGRWDKLRDELFGPKFYLQALFGLLDEWVVADLGCGTGAVAEALAPFVDKVIAVDGSDAMLDAARSRLDGVDNVELRRGELEALPLGDDERVDAATLMLVLHHVADPGKVVAEAARALRPAGRLLVVDMLPHDRQEYRHEMGHVWMGFSEEQIAGHLAEAGLNLERFLPLPAEPSARGPALFAMRARRPEASDSENASLNPSSQFEPRSES
jgi:ArsR family transcriptional regulator